MKSKKSLLIYIATILIISFSFFTIMLYNLGFFSQPEQSLSEDERLPNMPSEYHSHILLKGRRIGGCDTLTGNIKPFVIFLNTDDFIWTESEIQEGKKMFYDAINAVVEDALAFGQNISISPEFIVAECNSIIIAENNFWIKDALKSAEIYFSGNINDSLEKKYEVDEAPVIFVSKQSGRAHANNIGNLEYILLYNDFSDFQHEFYHIYGARDYYYPDELKETAKSIFNETIMLSINASSDDLTVYNLGWTNIPSAKALEFLSKTSHISNQDIAEELSKQWYTGYVTDWVTENGVYEGDLKEGLFDGYGIFKYNNGDVYEGNWKGGKIDGYGIYTYSNGSVCEGNWEKDKFIG